MATLVIILLILALIFGGIGLLVKAAVWALIIGLIFLAVSIVFGLAHHNRR